MTSTRSAAWTLAGNIARPLVICLVLFAVARADDDATPVKKADGSEPTVAELLAAGHSTHGEVFNEGPRQKAYLMGGTGNVVFPITTKNPEAQKFFLQGLGQLHGFWFFESERSFRQAAALDPDCAMAYWGMAMANLENEKRANGFIAEAVKRKAGVTPFEARWIDAIRAYLPTEFKKPSPPATANNSNAANNPSANTNTAAKGRGPSGGGDNARSASTARRRKLVRDLEAIIHEFPADLEAKAFLAKQIWQNSSAGLSITSHEAVNAIIEQVLAKEPLHPVHHYRIHLWDGEKPEWALASAARCGQSGSNVAHMWHMPGHIFSGLKRYEDAVWQQEASSRVDHHHMIHDSILPDQIHNYAHNQDWLAKNLTYIGRVRDAIDLAKNLIELPRHPKYNLPTTKGSSKLGRARLVSTLVKFELWDELIALLDTSYLEPADDDASQIERIKLRGVAWLEKGDLAKGEAQIAELESRLDKIKQERTAASDKAEEEARAKNASDDDAAKAIAEAIKRFSGRMKPLESALDTLAGHRALAKGDWKVADEKFKKTPPSKEAHARAKLLAGDKESAERLAREAVNNGKNEIYPLAHQADILYRLGKKTEAEQAFKQLRELASQADLDLPVMRRLAPLAKELKLADDWRTPRKMPSDLGDRPELASLGPFRWRPSPAPDWSLPDAQEKRVSLADYKGKPVVMIFYLGMGCLHCIEQLKAFAPLADKFSEAGISLVAISTDTISDVQQSLVPKEGNPTITFPILSDAEMNVFKAYRSYDDFEKQPLHATVLVDGNGLLRWHDVSFEPFTDAKFVLTESQRLLRLNPSEPTKTPAPTDTSSAAQAEAAGP